MKKVKKQKKARVIREKRNKELFNTALYDCDCN